MGYKALPIVGVLTLCAAWHQPSGGSFNVLIVTMDGMRWEEVFGGLAPELMTKEAGGVADAKDIERRFAAPTPAARRERLMPFFWSVIARQGQVFGDPAAGSSHA